MYNILYNIPPVHSCLLFKTIVCKIMFNKKLQIIANNALYKQLWRKPIHRNTLSTFSVNSNKY